ARGTYKVGVYRFLSLVDAFVMMSLIALNSLALLPQNESEGAIHVKVLPLISSDLALIRETKIGAKVVCKRSQFSWLYIWPTKVARTDPLCSSSNCKSSINRGLTELVFGSKTFSVSSSPTNIIDCIIARVLAGR